jgi:SOS-response transcriptional repressor LexA
MRCALYAIIDAMITVGKYLRKKRDEAELSLREASGLAHVSHTHIMDIEEGNRSPTFDKVMSILKAYRADALEFLRETGYLPKNSEPAATGKIRNIPVVSWVAAGKWAEAGKSFHQEDAVDWIESDIKGEHNFALRVKDDSMAPEFSEENIIIVNPNLRATSGDYVIVTTGDNEPALRQFKKFSKISVLHPLNPKYPDIVLKRDLNRRITGVILEKRQKYKE